MKKNKTRQMIKILLEKSFLNSEFTNINEVTSNRKANNKLDIIKIKKS